MQEFASVSASSYDPASLAAQLTEKSADGWSVVSIVPTGGDVTAFLSRTAASTDSAAATESVVEETVVETAIVEAVYEPEIVSAVPDAMPAAAAAIAEPAGWAVAPEPAVDEPAAYVPAAYEPAVYEPAAPIAPIVEPAPMVQAAPPYQPAAPVAPAVPAGWYADPAARFELRYWDGNTWTEHVSRAGQQFTDPPVA